VCIIAIVFSSYNIVCWIIENKNNNKLLSKIYEQTPITQEQISIENTDITISKLHYDFTNLLSTNPNTVGWINVPNTNIDYPVVQYSNNDYYLTHSFDNSENSAGWIFADYQNDCNKLGYNTVIYGHNRKDRSMFGSLKNVLESDWYSNEENLYINFSTLNETHVYKIFSAFVCNDTNLTSYIQNTFSSDEEFNAYIKKLKNSSSYNFDTNIDNTNQIITLYTCYGLNNQKLLVFATLVD
jgi:sortase B